MNKMAVAKWYDSDCIESVKIAAEVYGFEVLCMKPSENDNEAYVCVYGPIENVDKFLADNEEGDVMPFDSSTREMSDEEYYAWLSDKLSEVGVAYSPTFIKELRAKRL